MVISDAQIVRERYQGFVSVILLSFRWLKCHDKREAARCRDAPAGRDAELPHRHVDLGRRRAEIGGDVGAVVEEARRRHGLRPHHRAAGMRDLDPVFLAFLAERDFARRPAVGVDAPAPDPGQRQVAAPSISALR